MTDPDAMKQCLARGVDPNMDLGWNETPLSKVTKAVSHYAPCNGSMLLMVMVVGIVTIIFIMHVVWIIWTWAGIKHHCQR